MKNHGKRNVTDWQRMSRRQRESVRRRSDLGAVVTQLDEILREHNRLVVCHRALERFVLEALHTHPERTAGGLMLISKGSATPPQAHTAERLAELRNALVAELQAIEEAGNEPPEREEAAAG